MTDSATDVNSRSEVERIGHVCGKVTELWGKPEFSDYVQHLVFDSRDGARKGLPPAVAEDLMLLVEINKHVRAMRLAEKTGLSFRLAYGKIDAMDRAKHHGDALDNPLVSRDTVIDPAVASQQAAAAGRAATLAPGSRPRKAAVPKPSAGNTVFSLLTSKYLLGLVVLAVLAKTFWPVLGPYLQKH